MPPPLPGEEIQECGQTFDRARRSVHVKGRHGRHTSSGKEENQDEEKLFAHYFIHGSHENHPQLHHHALDRQRVTSQV